MRSASFSLKEAGGEKPSGTVRRGLQIPVLPATAKVPLAREQLSHPSQGTMKMLTVDICLLTSVV